MLKPFVALAFIISVHAEAWAWGDRGHSIVAEIAGRRLEPAVRQEVESLLGPGVSLASIASWPDAIRLVRPETFNWHFVDIPVEAAAYDPAEHCKPTKLGDCVLAAVSRLRTVLADRSQPTTARREALMFLVHFVGDMHQPLHSANRDNDEGGNKVRVIYLDRNRKPIEANLHQYWDFGIIDRRVFDWGAYVLLLEETWLPGRDVAQLAAGDPEAWAWEAHQFAVSVVYGKLPKNLVLDDDYYNEAVPVVDRQLAVAGLRLARLLNETLR